MFTSLKSVFWTVNVPVIEFNGVSARYAVPETSGDGSVPVEENVTNTPVDGVIVTVGVEVYPVPDVIRLIDITSPEKTEIGPVAGVESIFETVYVNVVAVLSSIEETIVPTAGVGSVERIFIVNVVGPVTVTL